MRKVTRRSVLASFGLVLGAFSPAQDSPRHPAVPGTGFDLDLAVCDKEIVVLRGGQLHRLPHGGEQWEALPSAPTGTVAIAGYESELWAVDVSGLVTVLDPAKGSSIRQFRLPQLPAEPAPEIRSIAVSAKTIVVCAVGGPGKGAAKRAVSILRLARQGADAAWLEVRRRDGTTERAGLDATSGGVVVTQSNCAVWLDPHGAPVRAATWAGRANAVVLDGGDAVFLVAERVADGKEPTLNLRRVRLAPRPCVVVEIIRDEGVGPEKRKPPPQGSVRWTVDGARCDTQPALVAALDRLPCGDEGPVVLIVPGNSAVYGDVATIVDEVNVRKLPVAFW